MQFFTMNFLQRTGLALVLASVSCPAPAWVYPEHRDIAGFGVLSLDEERQAVFNGMWAVARTGHEPRLCDKGADTEQGLKPACIDWAAFSGIAGDHSCSSRELVDTVLNSKWILDVAQVSAQLKADLAQVPVSATDDRALSGEIERRTKPQAPHALREAWRSWTLRSLVGAPIRFARSRR